MRAIDKLDKVPADVVGRAAASTRPGCPREQAEQCLRWPRSARRTRRSSTQVRALGVAHDAARRGAGRARRGDRRLRGASPGVDRRGRPAHRPRARLLHRHGVRDPDGRLRVARLDLLRRPLRLAGLATASTTYPGVGISLGVTRLLVPLLQRGVLTGVALGAVGGARRAAGRGRRAPRATRSRRRCGARGIAAEVAADRAEVRQADPLRRAARHPVRLVPRRRRSARGQGHPHRRPGGRPIRPTWTPPDDRPAPAGRSPDEGETQ